MSSWAAWSWRILVMTCAYRWEVTDLDSRVVTTSIESDSTITRDVQAHHYLLFLSFFWTITPTLFFLKLITPTHKHMSIDYHITFKKKLNITYLWGSTIITHKISLKTNLYFYLVLPYLDGKKNIKHSRARHHPDLCTQKNQHPDLMQSQIWIKFTIDRGIFLIEWFISNKCSLKSSLAKCLIYIWRLKLLFYFRLHFIEPAEPPWKVRGAIHKERERERPCYLTVNPKPSASPPFYVC